MPIENQANRFGLGFLQDQYARYGMPANSPSEDMARILGIEVQDKPFNQYQNTFRNEKAQSLDRAGRTLDRVSGQWNQVVKNQGAVDALDLVPKVANAKISEAEVSGGNTISKFLDWKRKQLQSSGDLPWRSRKEAVGPAYVSAMRELIRENFDPLQERQIYAHQSPGLGYTKEYLREMPIKKGKLPLPAWLGPVGIGLAMANGGPADAAESLVPWGSSTPLNDYEQNLSQEDMQSYYNSMGNMYKNDYAQYQNEMAKQGSWANQQLSGSPWM